MKRTFYSILLLALTSTTFVNCSSDDSDNTPVNPGDNNPNNPTNPTQPQLSIDTDNTTYYLGDVATFTATLNSENVTTQSTFYVDDQAISGNTYTTNNEGTFLVHASKSGATNSAYKEISFVVNPFADMEANSTFTHNSTNINNTKSITVYFGSSYDDASQTTASSLFSTYVFDGEGIQDSNNFVDFEFTTVYDLANNRIVLPAASNCTYQGIYNAIINQNQILTESYVGSGNVSYTLLEEQTQNGPGTANITLSATEGSHSFTLNYSGDHFILDGTSSGRSAVNRGTITKLENRNTVLNRMKAFNERYIKK